MDFTVGASLVSGYLLALARTAGFVLVAPPFNTKGVPAQVRAVTAFALAIPLSTWTIPQAPALTSPALVTDVLLQVVTGAGLGAMIMFAVAVVQIVGDLIDVAGGFSISVALDPLLQVQSSVMGRLHQLLALALLFASDGHLMVLQGLSRSFQLMPTGSPTAAAMARAATDAMSGLLMASAQIVAPVLAALFIADLALGLLTRAAPALNAFALAFPLKIALSLALIGLVLTQIPGALESSVRDASVRILQLSGG